MGHQQMPQLASRRSIPAGENFRKLVWKSLSIERVLGDVDDKLEVLVLLALWLRGRGRACRRYRSSTTDTALALPVADACVTPTPRTRHGAHEEKIEHMRRSWMVAPGLGIEEVSS
jgi:hypothetical protein